MWVVKIIRKIKENDMQKKIYVAGMFDDDTAAKVDAAVKAVAGVASVKADPAKSQVLVDYGDTSCEAAINAAISGTGVEVLN